MGNCREEKMINTLEADVGDCCWFLIMGENKPKYGTITKVLASESAIMVMEELNAKFYVVWENNAAWNEKELKGQKWKKPHNYKRDIPEEPKDEKKPSKRISNVRHRTKRQTKRKRTKAKS